LARERIAEAIELAALAAQIADGNLQLLQRGLFLEDCGNSVVGYCSNNMPLLDGRNPWPHLIVSL